MEYCSDRHDLVYKIKYRSSNPGGMPTEWHVCQKCFEKEEFGDESSIESITLLKNGKSSKVDVEKLSILTQKFLMNIKMLFFKH